MQPALGDATRIAEQAAAAAERAAAEAEAEVADMPTEACPDCGRCFNAAALARHIKICQKVFQQKRKAFDATKQRQAEGADKAAVCRPCGKSKDVKPVANNWKAKSEAFRAAMKQNRLIEQYQKEGRPLSELPPPLQTAPELDDRIPCPHCGRRFGQQQAERHIPRCPKKSKR